jgi:hypothetical protein
MAENTLARFDGDNGVELIIDTVTGESFATVSGYARMSGKAKSTISERLKGVALDNVKQTEIQTQGGLQAVRLISEDLITEWLPKDNPIMASQLMKIGVRVFLHKLAGFEVKSEAIAPQPIERILPTHTAVEYANAAHQVNSLPNGILKQLIQDALVDEISLAQNLKYLPVAEKPKQYTIVKVRAKQLGYTDSQIGDGKQLGKFVKSQINPSFQEIVGRYPVFHYEINDQLDSAINRFFA